MITAKTFWLLHAPKMVAVVLLRVASGCRPRVERCRKAPIKPPASRLRTGAQAFLLVAVPMTITPAFADPAQDLTVIEKYIAAHARRERGEEYRGARKLVTGDVNHDGVPETVVLYTIEGQGGSNNHVQYLAVFVRSRGRLPAVAQTSVGGKSYRAVELKSVRDNQIILETLDYLPSDPACCPSKKGMTRYVLVDRKLQEK